MKYILVKILIIIAFTSNITKAQPDTLNKVRLTDFILVNTGFYLGTGGLLNELWYSNYSYNNFHLFNDSKEWLQMDKIGHSYSAYYLSKGLSKGFKWTGCNDNASVLIGSTVGFFYMSSIEIFDGFSSKWGASLSDLGANFSGSALFVSQHYLWQEQRIIPKFSFHTTEYPQYRSNVLGENIYQQILKDYNGQTYWLSFNIKSLAQINKFPSWFNIAIGYGANGMIGGESNDNLPPRLPSPFDIAIPERIAHNDIRTRQYYISLDVDLTKIKTKSKLLRTIFSAFNMIKFPLPTVGFSKGKAKFYPIYF